MTRFSESIETGHHTVIEKDVVIGENVKIGDNTVILKGTQIGDNVEIGCNCVIGIQPGGNYTMRETIKECNKLIINKGTKIGSLVSLYSGTELGENMFIGDHASIRENVFVGRDTIIGRAAIVELNTTIGKNCTIQTLAYITGDTVLEDRVFIGPCVSMSNDKYMGVKEYDLKGPHVKREARIGNNASLLPGTVIGKKTVIGAGSVVTKNISDHEIVAGVPARKIRD